MEESETSMSERKNKREPRAHGIPAPRFRLAPETRPGRVRLQVADLERSREYYERVLGFQATRITSSLVRLDAGAESTPLIELHERPGAAPVPRRGRLGLYHYAILLPGRAALGAFARHLAELGEHAGASDHLVSEALYLRDPDGLGIEVYADRPRSEWRYRDGQLVMATEPLDLADLVRAAGDRSWSGMPAGATTGHIHLHVGDMGQATAFYHEALGLDKMVWNYPGALFLSAGGYHHHLGLNTWAAGARATTEDDARLLDWELVLPSKDEANRALASMESSGHAVERSAAGGAVRDPWGTVLRIHTVGNP